MGVFFLFSRGDRKLSGLKVMKLTLCSYLYNCIFLLLCTTGDDGMDGV